MEDIFDSNDYEYVQELWIDDYNWYNESSI